MFLIVCYMQSSNTSVMLCVSCLDIVGLLSYFCQTLGSFLHTHCAQRFHLITKKSKMEPAL